MWSRWNGSVSSRMITVEKEEKSMAAKKETGRPKDKNGKPMYSGFDCPVIGELHPKGTTVKRNPDGTITLVPPKAKKK